MSILSAIRQQSSSIDDLAKLPQAMIMQMAQRKQIATEMVAPILARKAEMIDAAARTRAVQGDVPKTSVMEQIIAQNAASEQPQILQPMPQEMPRNIEDTGVAQLPIPDREYAGGGIVAFQNNIDQPVSANMPTSELTEEEKRYLEENPYLQRSRAVAGLGGQLKRALTDPRNYNPIDLYQRNIGIPFANVASKFTNESLEDQAKRFRTAQMARTGEIPMFAGTDLTTKGKMVAEGKMKPNENITDVMQKERRFSNLTPTQLDDIARGQGVFPEGSPALPGGDSGVRVAKNGNVSTDKAKPQVKKEITEPTQAEKPPEEPLYSKYEKMLMDEREAAKGSREEAKYARLLEAGLGIMSGESPYAAVNIGKGIAPALKSYGEDARSMRTEERGRIKELLGIEGMRQEAKKTADELAIRKELAGYTGRQAAAAEKQAGRATNTEQIIALGKSAGLSDREIMTMLSGAAKDPDISARNIAMKAFYESPVLQAKYKNDINAFLRDQGIGAGATGPAELTYVPGKGVK